MKIVEVSTPSDIKKFHQVPSLIYKNDPNWIAHIKQEVEAVFIPKKNKYFEHGSAIRFILEDSNGKTVGRVAAFMVYRCWCSGSRLLRLWFRVAGVMV